MEPIDPNDIAELDEQNQFAHSAIVDAKYAPSPEREVDLALVVRVQQGDKRAYEVLVLKYQKKIQRTVSRFVRDAAEVEDITQDAFIKAYRALAGFRGDSAFYTWLYRIAVNTAKNFLQARGRRLPTTTEMDAEEAENTAAGEHLRDVASPERELMSKQLGQIVQKAVDKLPEDQRTALQLREIDGLSYEEIAEAMGSPVGTVRSRIFRAREAVAVVVKPMIENAGYTRW